MTANRGKKSEGRHAQGPALGQPHPDRVMGCRRGLQVPAHFTGAMLRAVFSAELLPHGGLWGCCTTVGLLLSLFTPLRSTATKTLCFCISEPCFCMIDIERI